MTATRETVIATPLSFRYVLAGCRCAPRGWRRQRGRLEQSSGANKRVKGGGPPARGSVMSQVPKPRSDRIAPLARLARRCSPALALLLLTGCLNERGALDSDPIRGGPSIPSRAPAPVGGDRGAGALASSPEEVPPLPPPYTPSSPAGLASGDMRTPAPKKGPGGPLRPPTPGVAPLGPATVVNAAPPPGGPPAPALPLTAGTQASPTAPAPAPAMPAALP